MYALVLASLSRNKRTGLTYGQYKYCSSLPYWISRLVVNFHRQAVNSEKGRNFEGCKSINRCSSPQNVVGL